MFPRGVTFQGETPFGAQLAIKRWRLDNGLTLLSLRDDSAPVVSYHTWIDVGSRHEQVGQRGMAHFFEHLMFLGTRAHPFGEFDRALEEVGAESNAATWYDFTSYYENLPAAALPLVVELDADRLGHLDVSPEQIDSEREVVLSEYRQRQIDDVMGRAQAELYRRVFKQHPYGRPTLGVPADLRAVDARRVRDFHRRFYAASNTTLVVVGDFDERELLELVSTRYGALPRRGRPRVPRAVEPPQRRARRSRLRQPTNHVKLLVAYRGPTARETRAHLALELLDEVLFDDRTGRVSHRLRETDELAIWVGSFVGPFADEGIYELNIELREDATVAAVEAVLAEEFARVRDEPVEEAELARAKARYELHLLTELESAYGKAERIGFDHLVLGDAAATPARLSLLAEIEVEDLLQAARDVLDSRRASTLEVLPAEASAEVRA